MPINCLPATIDAFGQRAEDAAYSKCANVTVRVDHAGERHDVELSPDAARKLARLLNDSASYAESVDEDDLDLDEDLTGYGAESRL